MGDKGYRGRNLEVPAGSIVAEAQSPVGGLGGKAPLPAPEPVGILCNYAKPLHHLLVFVYLSSQYAAGNMLWCDIRGCHLKSRGFIPTGVWISLIFPGL